jgi:hypothetical protein
MSYDGSFSTQSPSGDELHCSSSPRPWPIDQNDRDRRFRLSGRRRNITRRQDIPEIDHRSHGKASQRRNAASRGSNPLASTSSFSPKVGAPFRVQKDESSRPKISAYTPKPSCFNKGNLTDDQALRRVLQCFRRQQHQLSGRILQTYLNGDLPLDSNALHNIKFGIDNTFFDGVLEDKVIWEWSGSRDEGYENDYLGTTTPRYSVAKGTETVIVLSKPLLLSGKYSHDLLLSTFIHELVHCYLFITCGEEAQEDGGHTPAFQQIATLINNWTGHSRLRLCAMQANLDNFLVQPESDAIRGKDSSLESFDSCQETFRLSRQQTFDYGYHDHIGCRHETLDLPSQPSYTFVDFVENDFSARPENGWVPLSTPPYVGIQERMMGIKGLGSWINTPVHVS